MDKWLILAVAGAGKTTHIVNQIDLTRRFLIVTYTNNNINNLRKAIIRKFSYFPSNITLMSYYQFLLSICYNPYLKDICQAKGVCFKMPPEQTSKYKRNNKAYYITSDRYLYHNRIAKLCQQMKVCQLISNRIDKYYDCFFFDEIQDLAGHDFDLITQIIPHHTEVLFVGDYYQHTYDTSRDGNVNCNLYNDYTKYCKIWENAGLKVDVITLENSHRCSKTICDYVRNHIGINIYSNNQTESLVEFVDNQDKVDKLIGTGMPILFFRERNKYCCCGMNWGESKGLDDFNDVGVVLNKETLNKYNNDSLDKLAPSTKNKLYVALTRAKRNVYLIPYVFVDKYKIG